MIVLAYSGNKSKPPFSALIRLIRARDGVQEVSIHWETDMLIVGAD